MGAQRIPEMEREPPPHRAAEESGNAAVTAVTSAVVAECFGSLGVWTLEKHLEKVRSCNFEIIHDNLGF